MGIRDSVGTVLAVLLTDARLHAGHAWGAVAIGAGLGLGLTRSRTRPTEPPDPVSCTHLRAHETVLELVCRLLLEKKKTQHKQTTKTARAEGNGINSYH